MLSSNGEILARVIMEDAFQEAEAILDKARKEAASIQREALRVQAEMRRQAENSQTNLDIFLAKAKMVSQAELAARMEIIGQKEAILQEVLDVVRQELYALVRYPDYASHLLSRLTLEALGWLEGEEFIIQVNSRDRQLFTDDLLALLSAQSGKKLTLSEQTPDIEGGVIVVRSDGRLLYDNSLEAIFQRSEEVMRSAAARLLFN
ncbi:MAG: V-type proton ATPase subunit E [bacterium]|nr:V-type proton ATPase subunit E [bacterium]